MTRSHFLLALGYMLPLMLIGVRALFALALIYDEADQNRPLRLPPDNLHEPMEACLFGRRLRTVIEFCVLMTLSIAAVVYLKYRGGEDGGGRELRLTGWYLWMGVFFVYVLVGYLRGCVYVDAERIEIQGVFRRHTIDGDKIVDLTMNRDVVFMRVQGRRLPVVLWDYRNTADLYDLLWQVRWRNSGL